MGKTEIQKFEYLENKKSFLDEIKNVFQFLRSYHLVRDKNLIKNSGHKQALTIIPLFLGLALLLLLY